MPIRADASAIGSIFAEATARGLPKDLSLSNAAVSPAMLAAWQRWATLQGKTIVRSDNIRLLEPVMWYAPNGIGAIDGSGAGVLMIVSVFDDLAEDEPSSRDKWGFVWFEFAGKIFVSQGGVNWERVGGGRAVNFGTVFPTEKEVGDYFVFTGAVSGLSNYGEGSGLFSHLSTASAGDVAVYKDTVHNTLWIKVGNLSTATIADGSITGVKLADETITGGKIADGTITGDKVADSTITGGKIAADTVAETNLTAVVRDKLAGVSRHRVYLYYTAAHGADAPDTPTASYDGTTLSGIAQGWTTEFPLNSDFDTNDYYESVAWWSGTALEAWSAPFKIDHDPFVTPEELAAEARTRDVDDKALGRRIDTVTQAAATAQGTADAATTKNTAQDTSIADLGAAYTALGVRIDAIVGGNEAVDALVYDMEWKAEVQTVDDNPASPATIGIRIPSASHIIFTFPDSNSTAQINAMVVGRLFAMRFATGDKVVFTPTAHLVSVRHTEGYRTEVYGATFYSTGTPVDNEIVDLYRAFPDEGGAEVVDATTDAKGVVELATVAETTAGTDTARAVTPAGVKSAIGALAKKPALFTLSKIFAAGDLFYYGTDNRVLLFLVRDGQTFQASVDAPGWTDSTWKNYIFGTGNTTAKILLIADASDVANIVSVVNRIDAQGRLITTLTYEDVKDEVQTKVSAPLVLPSGNNEAIDALVSDMEFKAQVLEYDNEDPPVHPATIGLSFATNKVRFALHNNITKPTADGLVLNRRFAFSFASGVTLAFTPTAYERNLVINGFVVREYAATFAKTGAITEEEQVTLYRAELGGGGSGEFATGVAEVTSFVAYQAPNLPVGSSVFPQSFSALLGIIGNRQAHNYAQYAVPTTVAAFTQDGNYTREVINHNGADRTCLVITLKERLDSFTNIYFYTADATNSFPSPNIFGAKELAGYTAANGLGYSIQNMTSQTSSTHEGFICFSDGDKKIYMYETGTQAEYLGWVNLDRVSGQKGEKGDDGGAEIDDTSDDATKVLSSQKTRELVAGVLDSVPSWLQYFDYYYIGNDGTRTNIDGAGAPVLHNAALADGVFTFDSNREYVQLPAAVSTDLAAAEVAILGVIGNETGSNNHPFYFEAGDGRPTFGLFSETNQLGSHGAAGIHVYLSAAGTLTRNVEYGVAMVARQGSITGWIDGVEQLTVNQDWGFESDDVWNLGDNTDGAPGNFIGTMKQAIIMSTNAAYAALSTNEKATVIDEAAAWASSNDATKSLGVAFDLAQIAVNTESIAALRVVESKKDIFISPAHFFHDPETEGPREFVAVRAGNGTDLGVGFAQPTPPDAGAIEYGNINIAIRYADWNKCHKVGIASSHATSVMMNSDAFLYKDEITSAVTEIQLASADGRNSARVRLFENQNELGTESSTTHRLEISGIVGRVYIGRVRLVNLEVL